MGTKITAARIATTSGVCVRLADGRDPGVLEALLNGQRVGTVFHPSATPLPDRKGWLAHAVLPSGSLRIDGGAEQALLHRGASLLAVGIQAVDGSFGRHEPVRVLARDGRELARGLSRFSSTEIKAILGLSSEAIRERLGAVGDAVIHRNQLVLTPQPGGSDPAPTASGDSPSGPTIGP
jgi:glutamate 5-kinase